MCVKLPLGNLNPDPYSHTSQLLIFVEWPSHQRCVVVSGVFLKKPFDGKERIIAPTRNNFVINASFGFLEFFVYLFLVCLILFYRD